MVQREVGERFAAKPSTPAYGVPSVLAQLACDVRVIRRIPRGVFTPVPNVDSVLVGLTRHGPAPPQSLRTLVQHGFAHRRKALARSLSLAPGVDKAVHDGAGGALAASDHPAAARAVALAPADWRPLWERACRCRGSRPASSTCAFSWPRRAPAGCPRWSRSSSRPSWPTRSR